MGYQLGVDLGTTYTAAAVHEGGVARIVSLGNRTNSTPSVVYVAADGGYLFGDAAARRAREPDAFAREFKRRVGDTAPLRLRGAPLSAELLSAELLRWVVSQVSQLQGGPPDGVVLTHPANWGPYRLEMLDEIARLAGVGGYRRLTEPEAAALHYASQARVETGSIIAVYDLGGGTFDASVLRKLADRFEVVGRPEGVDKLGGIDFDEAVFEFVRDSLRSELDSLDPDDPLVLRQLLALRRDCVEVKEQLSEDHDAEIAVFVGAVQTQLTITRERFEALVAPLLHLSVEALARALANAQVSPSELRSVLLVGGASRMPMVRRLLEEALGGVPIALDAHPKEAVALGAALYGAWAAEAAAPASAATPSPASLEETTVWSTPPAPSRPALPDLEATTMWDEPPAPSRPAPRDLEAITMWDEPPAPSHATGSGDATRVTPAAASAAGSALARPQAVPGGNTAPPHNRAASGDSRRLLVAALVGAAIVLAVVLGLLLQGGDDNAGGGGEQTSTVSVSATAAWTDTGIDVGVGDQVELSASGEIALAVGSPDANSGPAGNPRPELRQFNRLVNGALVESPHGALLARVGESGSVLVVGAARSFEADSAGRLYLGVNDSGLENNAGEFTVQVTRR